MPRGGARNRSGPKPDESSARSDARGYSLTALPAEGYQGEVPEFPLPKNAMYRVEFGEKGARFKVFDEERTETFRDRELQLWAWAWTTPQACAWSMPSEHWRHYTVAMWVRTAAICESAEATAADKGSLHRFADQIGMTTAGLAEMGWKVAVDQVAKKAAEKADPTQPRSSARDRMKVVRASDGA